MGTTSLEHMRKQASGSVNDGDENFAGLVTKNRPMRILMDRIKHHLLYREIVSGCSPERFRFTEYLGWAKLVPQGLLVTSERDSVKSKLYVTLAFGSPSVDVYGTVASLSS